jgi:cyanate lyase
MEVAMTREECTKMILDARRQKGVTLQQLADAVGRHVVWTTAAIMGQATMDAGEAQSITKTLDLGPEVAEALQQIPTKGSLGSAVPVDPLMYRLHEITQIYGPSMKAVIHEMFGDGIMSAIDLEIDIQRVPNPAGDRVQITYNGKFLPARKW